MLKLIIILLIELKDEICMFVIKAWLSIAVAMIVLPLILIYAIYSNIAYKKTPPKKQNAIL